MPRTSHVATRPNKHVSDSSVPRCHGFLQQAPPQVCSWLVVERILHVNTYQVPGYSYLLLDHTLYVFSLLFTPFFWLVLPNKHSRIVCCCCCCIFIISLFFTFLPPAMRMRKGHMVVVLDQRSGAAYYIHKVKVMRWLCQLGCATININNVYSYTPRYVNKQSTPTTTPVVRICSCVTLFYT